MSLAYPLAFPTARKPRRITFRALSAVAVQESPFTFEQTVYAWSGDRWGADVEYAPMKTANAEAIVAALLLALNGQEGTFLMGPGDCDWTGPQGSWSAASPTLQGAHAAGLKTLNVNGVTGLAWTAGDWFQLGSGSASRLHKVVKSGSQAGSPDTGTLEIWPRLRTSYASGTALTLSAPKGVWRLAGDTSEWSIELARLYGLRFSCMEAR